MLLDGKVVVLSGVGPGFGLDAAGVLLREGARLVIAARSADRLESAAIALQAGPDVLAHQPTDITDPEQVEALVATALQRWGRLDGLAQVAANIPVLGPSFTIEPEVWRQAFETNLLGALNLVKAGREHLERTQGAIVFTGTLSSRVPLPGMAAYGATKKAAEGLMYYLATELGPSGIRVNTVETRFMRGPIVDAYLQQIAAEHGFGLAEAEAYLAAGSAMKRVPTGEDVANAMAFLLSDHARSITGQTLRVNAGEFME